MLNWLRAAGKFHKFVVSSVKVQGPLEKTIKQTVEFPN